MSYLQNIQRTSGKQNMGGIIPSLRVVRKDDVLSIPPAIQGIVYGDVVFKPGKGWVTWQFTTDTGQSKNQARNTIDGALMGNRVPFVVPRYSAELKNMFLRALNDEFIVLFTNTNGKRMLFGTLSMPVRFTFVHDTGGDFSSRNQFACEFYFDGPENMYEYNGLISSAPAGTPPAIVRFNGGVIATLQPGEVLDINSDYAFTEYFKT